MLDMKRLPERVKMANEVRIKCYNAILNIVYNFQGFTDSEFTKNDSTIVERSAITLKMSVADKKKIGMYNYALICCDHFGGIYLTHWKFESTDEAFREIIKRAEKYIQLPDALY